MLALKLTSRTPQECVDRNIAYQYQSCAANGRTPQECVDRNIVVSMGRLICVPSRTPQECVDRNMLTYDTLCLMLTSHSTGVRG